MPEYTFTVPDEVAAWIREEKRTEPQTYIQNNIVGPILKEYEKTLTKSKREQAEAEAKTEADAVRKKVKLEEMTKK